MRLDEITKYILLTEESLGKRLHIDHIEDAVFIEGKNGADKIIAFFKGLYDLLHGHAKTSIDLSIKWDGCVHPETILHTNLGELTILDVIRRTSNGETIQVLARDLFSEQNKMVDILGINASFGNKEWVELLLENNTSILLTADHNVHTSNRGWIRADELNEQDNVTEINRMDASLFNEDINEIKQKSNN